MVETNKPPSCITHPGKQVAYFRKSDAKVFCPKCMLDKLFNPDEVCDAGDYC